MNKILKKKLNLSDLQTMSTNQTYEQIHRLYKT
jgi:hypothetical protein